jgi:hypothetical protein
VDDFLRKFFEARSRVTQNSDLKALEKEVVTLDTVVSLWNNQLRKEPSVAYEMKYLSPEEKRFLAEHWHLGIQEYDLVALPSFQGSSVSFGAIAQGVSTILSYGRYREQKLTHPLGDFTACMKALDPRSKP